METKNPAKWIEGVRQAIETRFIGPTNYRGSRVKAKAQAGSVTIEWDHAIGVDENHMRAAQALADRYGWSDRGGMWIGGGRADSRGNVYVWCPDSEGVR